MWVTLKSIQSKKRFTNIQCSWLSPSMMVKYGNAMELNCIRDVSQAVISSMKSLVLN
jgi:hypothetical protein